MNAFGKFIEKILEDSGMDVTELASRVGVSRVSVSRHLHGRTVPHYATRKLYAAAIKMDVDVFEAAWRQGPQVPMEPEPAPIDPNVDPVPVETIRVPEFDLRIAAGPWIDIGDEAAMPDNSYAVVQGRFRVRIRGDSMEPRWPDGSMVEFRRIVLGREHVPFGEDCYVQTADGRATFKRLESGDEDQFVLRAVNTGKYPKKMTVAVQEVVNIAVAEAMVVVPKK